MTGNPSALPPHVVSLQQVACTQHQA